MATTREIDTFLNWIKANHPVDAFRSFDQLKFGLGASVRILYESAEPMTAGELSERLCVSTARVAVLIRNLEEKDLIRKYTDPEDRRKTLLVLTDQARETEAEADKRMRQRLGEVIDRIGMETLIQFFLIQTELSKAMQELVVPVIEETEKELFKS